MGAWSPGELDTIRRLYGAVETARLARRLGRSPEAVADRARALFRGARRRGPWTPAEEQRLALMIGMLPPEEIALVLGRARAEIDARLEERAARRLAGPWKPEEVALLKRIYGSRSDRDAALALGRSLPSVRRLAGRLCLAKDKGFAARAGAGRPMPRWSSQELERLAALYPERPNLELARLFGRSARSVAAAASRLGLAKAAELRARAGRENAALRAGRRPRD